MDQELDLVSHDVLNEASSLSLTFYWEWDRYGNFITTEYNGDANITHCRWYKFGLHIIDGWLKNLFHMYITLRWRGGKRTDFTRQGFI